MSSPHVGERLAQLTAGARGEGARIETVGAHEGEGDDGGGEHARVDEEDGSHAPPFDEESGRGGADEASCVEGGGVEGDGVCHLLSGNQLPHERLACRGVERGDRSRDEGQGILVPQLSRSGHDDDADDQGHQADARLRRLQEPPARDPIGENACGGGEEDDRQKLQGRDHTNLGGVVVGEYGEHVPVLRDALQPRAGRGNEGRREPVAVVDVAQ